MFFNLLYKNTPRQTFPLLSERILLPSFIFFLLLCLPAQFFPFICSEIQKHGQKTRYKAYGDSCHYVSSISQPSDQTGCGNPDCPQHQQIHNGRITDLSNSIHKADNPIKYRIAPGKWQNHANIVNCHLKNLFIPCKKTEHRTAAGCKQKTGSQGNSS